MPIPLSTNRNSKKPLIYSQVTSPPSPPFLSCMIFSCMRLSLVLKDKEYELPETYFSLSKCYYYQGHFRKSRKFIDKSLQLAPNNVEALKFKEIIAQKVGHGSIAFAPLVFSTF